MEIREKYVARLLNEPSAHGFSEIKFIHTPQVVISRWVRQRCQYLCHATRQSDYCPPFSPDADSTSKMLEEYKFGLFIRQEVHDPKAAFPDAWKGFQDALIESENECFVRGYGKAFAIGAGNCLFCHHDDAHRPCDFSGKSRPTLESIGVNLYDTLDMIGWEHHLVRDHDEPFQMFGLLLLE